MPELQLTPSQTVGPYYSIGLTWEDGSFVVPERAAGAFWIRGRVFDGDGEPVPDAVIESWQADPEGRYNHPDDPRGAEAHDFRGFARAPTDAEGRFGIHTVKPGPVPGPDGSTQAPHIEVSVFARGLLNRVVTRIYFADEGERNAADPVLQSVPEERRATLLAEPVPEDGYRFDVHLQGEGETVFFAI
jgi:protocatechuate 3,4-dioxygenase alpha subunit